MLLRAACQLYLDKADKKNNSKKPAGGPVLQGGLEGRPRGRLGFRNGRETSFLLFSLVDGLIEKKMAYITFHIYEY